jgi:hypothetical protein
MTFRDEPLLCTPGGVPCGPDQLEGQEPVVPAVRRYDHRRLARGGQPATPANTPSWATLPTQWGTPQTSADGDGLCADVLGARGGSRRPPQTSAAPSQPGRLVIEERIILQSRQK